jgi:hypothetical protein
VENPRIGEGDLGLGTQIVGLADDVNHTRDGAGSNLDERPLKGTVGPGTGRCACKRSLNTQTRRSSERNHDPMGIDVQLLEVLWLGGRLPELQITSQI